MANNLAAAAQTNDSENASHSESQSESQRVDGQPVAYVNHAMEEWFSRVFQLLCIVLLISLPLVLPSWRPLQPLKPLQNDQKCNICFQSYSST